MMWDEKQLHWHLRTRRFGRQCQYFDEIDSTNRWLLENPHAFSLTGGVVIAGHQTAGRGRQSRSWADVPTKALLCSVMLKLRGKHPARGFISIMPAIALARALNKHDSELEISLKWPNDVLLSHKKVAGILAETTNYAESEIIVVGVGINLTSEPQQEFMWPATCIAEQSSWRPTREILLAELLNEWEPLFDQFLDADIDGLRKAWQEYGPVAGARMKRIENSHTFEGEFAGLGDSGQLLLRDQSGELREVFSGDIGPA